MKFSDLPLPGARLIQTEKHGDQRGFFARQFCAREFAAHGLPVRFAQMNHSRSTRKHTLRGMHYQLPPAAETKLVFCPRGALFDVIIDLRPDSPTFKQHATATLSDDNGKMLLIPKGFAHGFMTLSDNADIFYINDEFHAAEHERGIRWNDPVFNIPWPAAPAVISDRDANHPDFSPAHHLGESVIY